MAVAHFQFAGRRRRDSTATGSDSFQGRGSAYLRAILTNACARASSLGSLSSVAVQHWTKVAWFRSCSRKVARYEAAPSTAPMACHAALSAARTSSSKQPSVSGVLPPNAPSSSLNQRTPVPCARVKTLIPDSNNFIDAFPCNPQQCPWWAPPHRISRGNLSLPRIQCLVRPGKMHVVCQLCGWGMQHYSLLQSILLNDGRIDIFAPAWSKLPALQHSATLTFIQCQCWCWKSNPTSGDRPRNVGAAGHPLTTADWTGAIEGARDDALPGLLPGKRARSRRDTRARAGTAPLASPLESCVTLTYDPAPHADPTGR